LFASLDLSAAIPDSERPLDAIAGSKDGDATPSGESRCCYPIGRRERAN
jgi:hypothetical protein